MYNETLMQDYIIMTIKLILFPVALQAATAVCTKLNIRVKLASMSTRAIKA